MEVRNGGTIGVHIHKKRARGVLPTRLGASSQVRTTKARGEQRILTPYTDDAGKDSRDGCQRKDAARKDDKAAAMADKAAWEETAEFLDRTLVKLEDLLFHQASRPRPQPTRSGRPRVWRSSKRTSCRTRRQNNKYRGACPPRVTWWNWTRCSLTSFHATRVFPFAYLRGLPCRRFEDLFESVFWREHPGRSLPFAHSSHTCSIHPVVVVRALVLLVSRRRVNRQADHQVVVQLTDSSYHVLEQTYVRERKARGRRHTHTHSHSHNHSHIHIDICTTTHQYRQNHHATGTGARPADERQEGERPQGAA